MSFNNTDGLRRGTRIAGMDPPEPENGIIHHRVPTQDRHTRSEQSTASNITELYNSDDHSITSTPSVLSTTGGTVRTVDPPESIRSHRSDPPSIHRDNQQQPQPRTTSDLSYQSTVPNSITTGTGATRNHLQTQIQNVTARILALEHGQEAHSNQLQTINENFPPIMQSLARILTTLDSQQQYDTTSESSSHNINTPSDVPTTTTTTSPHVHPPRVHPSVRQPSVRDNPPMAVQHPSVPEATPSSVPTDHLRAPMPVAVPVSQAQLTVPSIPEYPPMSEYTAELPTPLQHPITQRGGYYPPTPPSLPYSEDTHQSFTPPLIQPPAQRLVQTELPFRAQQPAYSKPPDFPKFKDKTTEYNHWKVRCQLTLAQARDPLFSSMVTRNATGLTFNIQMTSQQQGALFLLTSSALSETFSQSIISTTQLLQANGMKLWQKLDDHFVEQEGNSVVLTSGLKEAFNGMTRASNESIFNFTHRFEKAYSKCVYHKLSVPTTAELTCQFIKALKMPKVFAVIITNLDKSDYADYITNDIEELGKKLKKFHEIVTVATGIDPYPLTTATPVPPTPASAPTPTPTAPTPTPTNPTPTPSTQAGRGRAANPARQPPPAVVANMAEIKSRLLASTNMVTTIRDTHFQCVNGNRCYIHQLNSDHDFLKCYKLKAVCKEIDEANSNSNAMTALTNATAIIESSRGGPSPAPSVAPVVTPVVSAPVAAAPVAAAPVPVAPPPGMIQQQQYAPPMYAQQYQQYAPQYQFAPRPQYYSGLPRQRVQNPYNRTQPPVNPPLQHNQELQHAE